MKILIADDHWLVRDSIKHVLERVKGEFEPFDATTFEEAITILEANPGIALMVIDLIMPGFDEFAGLAKLKRSFPNIPIIVLSVHEDRDYVMKSIAHGVVGYIPKSTSGTDMVRAFSHVLEGDVSFPRHVLTQVSPAPAQETEATPPQQPRRRAVAGDAGALEIDTLTPRERDVLKLLGQGLSDSKIAGAMNISPNTVRVHVRKIMLKLGLADRAETIHYAVKFADRVQTLAG
ncbi:MAG: response regulator transcription factor [Rhodospirillales bacterium]